MSHTKIFVMTHKNATAPEDEAYELLQVGRAAGQDLGYRGDDTGENISALNCYWGELTGFYWIWKNYSAKDYIGVCHYRRFFGNGTGNILSGEEADSLLEQYDLVTSDRVLMEQTEREMYAEAHNIRDMQAVEHAMQRRYPEFYDALESVLDGKETYYGNLLIMPAKMFADYCEWLFTLLDEAATEIDITGYDAYHARVFGFLSEPLLLTWVRHFNLRPYESPIIYTSEKAETKELKKAMSLMVADNRIDEAVSLFSEVLKVRPDLELPASDILHEVPVIGSILAIIRAERGKGEDSFYQVSNNLKNLIRHYKEIHRILLAISDGRQTTEDRKYLKDNRVSDTAILFMLQNDLYPVLNCKPIEAVEVRRYLSLD